MVLLACIRANNSPVVNVVRIKYVKVKVKWSRYMPGVAQRVGRGIALLFHDRGTRRGWVVSSTPSRTLPAGKTRYPLYRRLGGPQGRSGRAENLIRTGIRSRTVQPVVSHYTDWATQPLELNMYHVVWNDRNHFTAIPKSNSALLLHILLFPRANNLSSVTPRDASHPKEQKQLPLNVIKWNKA